MHFSAIPAKTKKVFDFLANSGLVKDFYLAGGTALALYMGHRYSYDLDFFSLKGFRESVLVQRFSLFNAHQTAKFYLENESEQTINAVLDGVKVSFLGYRYPLLKPCQQAEGILVADIVDAACMKIDTIAKRGARRDFIDLFFICREAITLPDLMSKFSKKYATVNYNMVHIKKSLVYFTDAERDPMPNMLKQVDWHELKNFFQTEIAKLK